MEVREAEASVWESHKEDIRQLYETEGLPLFAVMESMEARHGFNRTLVFLQIAFTNAKSSIALEWSILKY